MSSGFNGMPNIKMEDGGMGSIPGLKVSTLLKQNMIQIVNRHPA